MRDETMTDRNTGQPVLPDDLAYDLFDADIAAFLRNWRAEARRLRERHRMHGRAATIDSMLGELVALLEERALRKLTLADAVGESGVSRRTLERYLADGVLTDVGEEGAPRVLACELPRRPRKVAEEVITSLSRDTQAKKRGRRSKPADPHDGQLSPMKRVPLAA
jgi:hypothetical protein